MSSPSGTVLLVATNGVGLGHVTRAAAVARRLQERGVTPVLCTLSPLIAPLRALGLLVEHIPSYAVTGLPRWHWQRVLADQLRHLVEAYDVGVVAFDGVAPYQGVRRAMATPEAPPYVWVRRGRRRHDAGAAPSATGFTAVVEPGELLVAGDGGSGTHPVEPVVLHDHRDLVAPDVAAEVLGLPAGGRYGLVSLGTGAAGALGGAEAQVVAALRARGIEPVVARSPLLDAAGASGPARRGADGVWSVARYPLAPLLGAFDVGVVAAGYNTVAEVVASRLPAVLVPNPEARTDDQAARAGTLATAGVAATWTPPPSSDLRPGARGLEEALEACVGTGRAGMLAAMEAVPAPQGASQAAALLTAVLRRGGGGA